MVIASARNFIRTVHKLFGSPHSLGGMSAWLLSIVSTILIPQNSERNALWIVHGEIFVISDGSPPLLPFGIVFSVIVAYRPRS